MLLNIRIDWADDLNIYKKKMRERERERESERARERESERARERESERARERESERARERESERARERESERERERERDAEQGDTRDSIKTRGFRTLILKLVNPLIQIHIWIDFFPCTPSFLFLFSKAAQHGPTLFVPCSRGQGLSGFVM